MGTRRRFIGIEEWGEYHHHRFHWIVETHAMKFGVLASRFEIDKMREFATRTGYPLFVPYPNPGKPDHTLPERTVEAVGEMLPGWRAPALPASPTDSTIFSDWPSEKQRLRYLATRVGKRGP